MNLYCLVLIYGIAVVYKWYNIEWLHRCGQPLLMHYQDYYRPLENLVQWQWPVGKSGWLNLISLDHNICLFNFLIENFKVKYK